MFISPIFPVNAILRKVAMQVIQGILQEKGISDMCVAPQDMISKAIVF